MAANSRFAMATHIMTALAVEQDKLNSSYLAASLNTNPVVVRRILSELQKAGLLETEAGRSGGARLAKKPNLISLYQVYAAVEDGPLFAYNPNDPNKQCSLSCKMKSVLSPVFDAANEAMTSKLKKIKLSDLVEEVDTG
jgi:Rrf2 family protein